MPMFILNVFVLIKKNAFLQRKLNVPLSECVSDGHAPIKEKLSF